MTFDTEMLTSTGALLSGIGALVGALGAWVTIRYTKRSSADARVVKQARDEREKIAVKAAEIDAITRRFETLIDGYENRITDLTAEVTALRKEVADLRKALDRRPFHPSTHETP